MSNIHPLIRLSTIIIWVIIIILLFNSLMSRLAIPLPAPTDLRRIAHTPSTISGLFLNNSISRTPYDQWPGISTAVPGTFDRIFRNFLLRLVSTATTPSTYISTATSLLTSTSITEAATNAAGATRIGGLIVSFIYISYLIGSYFSDHCW
jgi:hypothetical protein